MGVLLSVLRVLETVYIVISFAIVFFRKYPQDLLQVVVSAWVVTSLMILPVLLFKNVLVAILNNGVLTSNQKTWILVRCALYVLFSFIAFPIISQYQ